jgi:hypothetical protein
VALLRRIAVLQGFERDRPPATEQFPSEIDDQEAAEIAQQSLD